MIVKVKKVLLGILYLFSVENLFSQEFTMEELNELKRLNMISQEDYEIFLNELVGVKERDHFYKLKINNSQVTNTYPVIFQKDKYYLPIFSFFRFINFKNYSIKKGVLNFTLGTQLKKVKIELDSKDIIHEKEDYFIESNLFKKLLLEELYISNEIYQISMATNFETDEKIKTYLNNVQERIIQEKNSKELIYTDKRDLFELGYTKFNLQGNFNKDKHQKKFEKNWSGSVEYQGPLLYGEFTGTYDLKESELGNLRLYYPEIYKGHSFDIENNSNREWRFVFKKEKGFYNKGKNYIISEKVPIGSKVELLYMGFPIDIKDEVDGTVTFDNSEIKEDRKYTLKVYPINGNIYTIEINTASYYYQQNKDEIEYDINIQEDSEINRYLVDGNIYYGLTNNLTLGAGYSFLPEENQDKKIEDIHFFKGSGVYTNYILTFPYTVVLGGETSMKKDRYSFDFSYQIDIKDFGFTYDRDEYGEYFNKKIEDTYSISYNPFNFIQLSYDWSDTSYHNGENENSESANLNLNTNFKDLLITFDYSKYLDNKDNYKVNFYYNGLKNFNVQLNNYWTEGGEEVEHILKLSNKNIFNILDYSFEMGYSEKYKEKFTFRFTIDYDNWFRGDFNINENGNQMYSMGINRVVDLKNIRKPLESMDSSRVHVTTFLDKNNDGIKNENEEPVEYVKVKIGSQEINTDKDGKATFFGVPNEISYDVKTTIRNPSLTSGNTKVKVLGKQVGSIYVDIPIKPMVIIKGIFKIDDKLNLNKNEKISIFENTLIKVIDKKGETIEYVSPELDGTFEVHGLLAEDYILSIEYIGLDNKSREILRRVKLGYYDDKVNQFIIHLTEDRLTLIQKYFSKGGEHEKVINSNITSSKL